VRRPLDGENSPPLVVRSPPDGDNSPPLVVRRPLDGDNSPPLIVRRPTTASEGATPASEGATPASEGATSASEGATPASQGATRVRFDPASEYPPLGEDFPQPSSDRAPLAASDTGSTATRPKRARSPEDADTEGAIKFHPGLLAC
jgi:hypothetical protein